MKKIISGSLTIVLFLVVHSCTNENNPANPPMDALFDKYNTKTGPGCALAVIENDEVVYKKGYGNLILEFFIHAVDKSKPIVKLA